MRTLMALVFVVASILATSSHASREPKPYQIYPLRLKSGSGSEGPAVQGVNCPSWRLAVEAHNIISWRATPECEDYVREYMVGHQYREDSKFVTEEASHYARNLNLTQDEKNIWVFDIDETSLSHLPFFLENGFGNLEPLNLTKLYEWFEKGIAPALPDSLKLYNELVSLGFRIVFLTGRTEDLTQITAINLKRAGYHTWQKLILRSPPYNETTMDFKIAERRKLEESGFKIVGNIGDQWGDILGTNAGDRTFKLPNPMYYGHE